MFYVHGPGESGETYLYNFLSNYFEGRGVAWTGVAETLLHKGKTVHPTFKIPLNPNSESSSLMKHNSEGFEHPRELSIFIIDEVSMMAIDLFVYYGTGHHKKKYITKTAHHGQVLLQLFFIKEKLFTLLSKFF